MIKYLYGEFGERLPFPEIKNKFPMSFLGHYGFAIKLQNLFPETKKAVRNAHRHADHPKKQDFSPAPSGMINSSPRGARRSSADERRPGIRQAPWCLSSDDRSSCIPKS